MWGINTGLPNRIAEEAIAAGQVSDLDSYSTLRREQRYGRNSRVDILLADPLKGLAYVEVKNVHFSRVGGLAEFPDSPTERGAKHLEELGDMVEAGHRAIMLYLVQRNDCALFRICRELDPAYARAFERAIARGVEAYAVRCAVSPAQIVPAGPMIVDETGPRCSMKTAGNDERVAMVTYIEAALPLTRTPASSVSTARMDLKACARPAG